MLLAELLISVYKLSFIWVDEPRCLEDESYTSCMCLDMYWKYYPLCLQTYCSFVNNLIDLTISSKVIMSKV